MRRLSLIPLFVSCAWLAGAHPMGNFSVSHYAKFDVSRSGIEMQYALDLAEIPSFELLRQWNLADTSLKAVEERKPLMKEKAARQAREWARNLHLTVDGKPVTPRFEGADISIAEGAGQMPILRITARLHLAVAPGKLEYEDGNYAGRAGWKEIVISAREGATIQKASQQDTDRSKGLTAYPQDGIAAPPQDVRAALEWTVEGAPLPIEAASAKRDGVPNRDPLPKHDALPSRHQEEAVPLVTPVPQPKSLTPSQATSSFSNTAQSAPAGTVVRGDFLSRLLGTREISFTMMLLGIAVAFGLGGMHALSPGHGKTIVAAYLVGARGTLKHAAFLGAMVTFTHTVSVFLLGLGTLFLAQYIVPEKIYPVLGAISGITIVCIGASLFVKRWRKMSSSGHDHHHDHAHGHDHTHGHDHHHDHGTGHVHHHHDHGHDHDHSHHHDHDHGPHGHSHVPEGEVTMASLIALGASGGLVPCPSALVLLLSSIALGHVGLGLFLLVGFSLGLAVVLMAIGAIVVYAKNLLPDTQKAARHPAFRLVPVLSAAVIVCLGLIMTGVSLGWLQPLKFIG